MSKKEEIQERRIKVLKLYKEGLVVEEIAEKLYCHVGTIYNDLNTLQKEETTVCLSKKREIEERKIKVIKLFKEGFTIKEIAEKLSSYITTINRDLSALDKAGMMKEIKRKRRKRSSKIEMVERSLTDLRILEKVGMASMGLKKRRKRMSKSMTEKRRIKVLRLYEEGFIAEEIAEKLYCHVGTIYSDLDVLGK